MLQTLIKLINSISFFHKQLIAIMAINILPLVIMSGLLYSNSNEDYKNNLIEVMQGKITLLAASSSSALLFDDKQVATHLLSHLKLYRATRYAQIYDANLNVFAEYKRSGESIDMPIGNFNQNAFFKNQNIYLSHQIMMGDEKLGVIVISADTISLQNQQQRYILIAALVFLGSFLLTYILNWRLQKLLNAPITDLIELVGYVADKKKYHKRLNNNRNDEIGKLILGVNTMLNTIEKHESQLYNSSNYDDLTKLPNRHLLTERLSHGISTAERNRSELALLFLDLDRFKIINDSLGHYVGDQLLVQVATKLTKLLSQSDSVFRWGGDEFVVVLENIQKIEDVESFVRKIMNELSNPIHLDNHLLHVSTSIGITRYPKDGTDSVSLIKHADISMYQAKVQGPGHYRYFNQEMLNNSVHRLTLEMQVHQAFEKNDFFMVYQPQMSIDGESILGFEALIRWKCDGVFISPEQFLPLVDDLGLMEKLTLWVLEQACRQNVSWQKAGLTPVKIAVNFPASFIMQSRCLEDIYSVLTETGLAPKFLEVELTENTFLDSTSISVSVLQSLKDLGVNIAIDDFGTGYSCMSYLQDLPIDTLKIDGSFIKGLGQKQANDGIVQSIITLGKSLNMLLVAECVETQEQLNILKNMQCDIIQGYLFSKPLSMDDATKFIASKEHKYK
jgi:diguanylate cyclase (GGDEF)-like protein